MKVQPILIAIRATHDGSSWSCKVSFRNGASTLWFDQDLTALYREATAYYDKDEKLVRVRPALPATGDRSEV